VQRAGIAAGAPFCCSCISIQGYMHHPPHPSDHDGDDDDDDDDDDDGDDDDGNDDGGGGDDDDDDGGGDDDDGDGDDGDDDDDDADAAGKQKNTSRVEYPSLFVVAACISISCSSSSNRSTRRGLILVGLHHIVNI